MDFRGLVWSENGCRKWHCLVWNKVRIWRTGRYTRTKNSQEYPPRVKITLVKVFLNKLTPGVSCPDTLNKCSIFIFVTDVSRQLHPIVIHLSSGLPPMYDVSGPSLWLNFHFPLMVKGNGCLKTVWLLSTEHLDHWQGSYKTINLKKYAYLIMQKGIFEHR